MTYLKETNGVGVYNTLKAKDVTTGAFIHVRYAWRASKEEGPNNVKDI